jgi:hypothetical protein
MIGNTLGPEEAYRFARGEAVTSSTGLPAKLPEHAIPLALAFFNVGVELGQLLFIAVVFGLLWLLGLLVNPATGPRNHWRLAERLSVPAAYLVGTVAMFWFFERTYNFLV